MTTRNFRVNNGLEVGDIVISASANTIVGGATAAPSADGQFANKKYVDDQAAATLTLTNKTLTAPKIADAGFIADANGNESVIFQTTTSAVNELEITNAATGNGPILGASGETNVPINITAKGTGNILLNAGSDVVIPANKGLQFVDANEKIESDGTDLTINSGAKINLTATTDVHIPNAVGLVFGDGGEHIETNNTDFTITSGGKINLATASDVHMANDKGIVFGDAGEKIEGTGALLKIDSSDDIQLNAGAAVVIPINIPLEFVDANEKIASDGTHLTVTAASGAINLSPLTDVILPSAKGIVFGDAGEKIEGDGTNLVIASSGLLTLTATGETVITNNLRVAGNLTIDGTETVINTSTLSVEDNIIEVNRNVSANSGMPSYSGIKVNRGATSAATEKALFWVWDEGFADDGTTTFGNAGGAFTAFKRADNDTSLALTGDLVDVRCNVVHAVSTSALYADVAERFAADAPMAEGAVVMLGGSQEITEVDAELSDTVFGVVSQKPAYAMNAGAGNNDSHPFVAMTGRTPVRVTGQVSKGQRLVASSTKGTARGVTDSDTINPFHVIGRALEDKNDDSIGMVLCVVRTNN